MHNRQKLYRDDPTDQLEDEPFSKELTERTLVAMKLGEDLILKLGQFIRYNETLNNLI